MRFSRIIRKTIAVADQLTADLQVTVLHYAWIGTDSVYSKPLFDEPVSRRALVEIKDRLIRLPDGRDITQRAQVTFMRPIAANGAAERREPIDLRDKIVLPNGYSGPIKYVEGLATELENSPYMLEVILG